MMISHTLKRYTLILLSFSLFTTSWLHPEQSSPITLVDQIISEGQKQLEQLAIISSTLSGMLNNQQTQFRNKYDALTHLQALITLIKNLRTEKFIDVDIETAHALAQFCNIITDHLNETITNNFKDIEIFQMEDLVNRALVVEEVSPEDILFSLAKNQQKIQILRKKADSFGLKWYNFATRNVYNYIIDPAIKHDIPYRVFLGAATSTLGLYWWRRLHNETYQQWVPQSVRNIIGDGEVDIDPVNGHRGYQNQDAYTHQAETNARQAETNARQAATNARQTGQQPNPQQTATAHHNPTQPDIPQTTSAPTPDAPQNDIPQASRPQPAPRYQPQTYALFDRIDYSIALLKRDFSAIGLALHAVVAAGWSKEASKFYPKLKKQISIWGNRLKGGSHLKEAQKLAEVSDNVRFTDIFGQDEIKRYWQLLVDYLENPEPFDRLGLTPPKGILCVGDTRTGKTFSVQALLGEIKAMQQRTGSKDKFKFLNLSAAMIDMYGLTEILKEIKQAAPCIVFIDEIDLLYLQRHGHENKKLSEFLVSMSGTIDSKDSKNQVIIIAATNKPESLDVALRQPGRFGKEIRFEYPNYQDRIAFISHKLEKLSLDPEQFDIDYLAQVTEKKSYEALTMLLNNALLKARNNHEMINQEHLNATLDEDVLHIIPHNSKNIPMHEQEILAAHLAAQALTLIKLQPENKLSKVTIKQVMTDIKEEFMGRHLWTPVKDREKNEQQRFEYGKLFMNHSKDSIHLNSRAEKIKQIQTFLAGFIGEEIMHGSCGYSCHKEDAHKALELAQSITFEGLDSEDLPKHIYKIKYDAALKIIETCKKATRELLMENKKELEIITSALLQYKTLDAQIIQKLIQNPQEESNPIATAS